MSYQVALLIPMGIVLLLPACRQQKAAEKVEGTVLDTAGKPVASVRVFNSGDGPTRIETYTDQFGRFRLDGFNSGPVYVFAEKAGCRFAGVRTTAGSTGVAIKLLQQTEPMPMRAIASASMPLDQQQELARKIVEKIWADDSRSKRCTWVMMAMSRINPELALRWSTQIGPGCVNLVRAATAEKIADEDFDEALSLIGQSGSNRPNTLVKLARRYTVPNPAKALRCAEELVVAARAVDQPWRTGYLAQAGGLAIRLGKKEAGQKLLDEAGKMADKLGTEGQNAGARGMVARAMAPSDFQRALSLLKPITSSRNDLDQLRADVAVAGCLQHLDQALAIVAKIESAYTANAARLRIAYRLAPTRPTDAIRVAESIASGRGVPCEKPSKAEALSWVAVAVAPCDKTLACSLIDRAFTILMAPDASGSALNVYGMFSGWRVRAAFLAVQAQRIGYPDMESVVDRVLACRPSMKDEISNGSGMEALESQVVMAAFLGLVDSQAARHMLVSIERQRKTIVADLSATGRPVWVKAWLLVDAKRGQSLLDDACAAIKDKPGTDTEFYELVEAAELLTAPPHEKAQHILSNCEFHLPEEEQ